MRRRVAAVGRAGLWLTACLMLLAGARSLGASAPVLLATLASTAAGAAAAVAWPRRERPSGALPAPQAAAPPGRVVRAPQPPLWAPASEHAPHDGAVAAPGAIVPPRPPVGPPPEPHRAWAAEIEWRHVGDASRFDVIARTGAGEAVSLSRSEALAWPPSGPSSVQALTHAVRTLESDLVAAGWKPLPGAGAWYAKRFAWLPGGQPVPPSGRARHRALYEAEYARQVRRTHRLRTAIENQVRVRPEHNGHAPSPPE